MGSILFRLSPISKGCHSLTVISFKMSFLDNFLLKGSQFKCDGAPQARNRRQGRSAAPRAPRGTWGSAGPLGAKMGSTFLTF